MEEMVRELRKLVSFKETTGPGDLVLVANESSKSVFYAMVTDIVRDESRRDEWWHVSMQILNLPPQKAVWTLREPQFTGKELFTINGDGHFMQALDFARSDRAPEPNEPPGGGPRPRLKRVK